MKQAVLNQGLGLIDVQPVGAPIDKLGASVKNWIAKANRWLDSESSWYSRFCQERVTWRSAMRVNLITTFIIVGAAVVESAPVPCIVSFAIAAYFAHRLNGQEKGGEA